MAEQYRLAELIAWHLRQPAAPMDPRVRSWVDETIRIIKATPGHPWKDRFR